MFSQCILRRCFSFLLVVQEVPLAKPGIFVHVPMEKGVCQGFSVRNELDAYDIILAMGL